MFPLLFLRFSLPVLLCSLLVLLFPLLVLFFPQSIPFFSLQILLFFYEIPQLGSFQTHLLTQIFEGLDCCHFNFSAKIPP